MNTLNNIHALVDIDPEQAKETIVELSKIMRFVLYEGSKQKVSLRREMIFLDNYIQLMRLRVAEQVDISVDIRQVIPDKDIPPLMMITFVENAFKHCVSYQQHSFIDISIQIADDQLHFHCRNSKVPQGEDRHGGVGLQNVKKRLQLIYGSTYTLDIKDESETYTVDLTLPL
jgi:LytS/YehU family sensor histidine kinase